MSRLAALLLIASAALAQPATDTVALLQDRVRVAKKAHAIIVGIVDPNGRAAYEMSPEGETPVGPESVFEIGSATKVFTSLLLADMIERGEVKPDDPVAKYLPENVKAPAFNGKPITLVDLSMHLSGLPRLPANLDLMRIANPYAAYGPDRLYEFLSGYALTRAPGERYEYSNLGAGLLGLACARRAGMSWEEAVKRRILIPLGMRSTAQTITDDLKRRLVQGHDADLKPVSGWDFDALAGAGALRSTLNDMLTFVAANLELTDTPLKPAMRRMRAMHRATGIPETEIAMGWHVLTRFGSDLWFHNGQTGGFRSFLGFNLETKRGAVVLSDTAAMLDDVGAHLVDSRYEAKLMGPPRTSITLDAATLESYVGEYALAPTFSITVRRDGTRLFIRATNQGELEVFASKKDEVFLRAIEAQISFIRDGEGKVTRLVLHQNGRDIPGKKK